MAKTPAQKAAVKRAAYLRSIGRPTKVPIEVVRPHVRKLHFKYGMAAELISRRSGFSEGSIREIINGHRTGTPVKEIFRDNAAKLLAVQGEYPAIEVGAKGGTRVDATGTMRRAQALNALGYPMKWIAVQMGSVGRTFYQIAWGERKFVYFSTALRMQELYGKLENDAFPEGHGISQQAIRLAKFYADKRGYPPPGCWDPDTIDDPEAFPEWTGECGSEAGYQIHFREKDRRFWAPDLKRHVYACAECRKAHAAYKNPTARPKGRPRQTHCQNGHEMAGDNVYERKDGKGRMCVRCNKERARDNKQARTVEAENVHREA